jgi:hypothetical protein
VSQLIDFYSGRGNDHRGRKLEKILSWDDDRLESVHDYIQWLFPLAEPSRFNPHAPLLNETDRAEFQSRPNLQANVLRALRRMLAFYGFLMEEPSSGAVSITPSGDVRHHWLSPGNHNYLRITRILTSLRLIGLGEYARAFFAALEHLYAEHGREIGETTYSYWRSAAGS